MFLLKPFIQPGQIWTQNSCPSVVVWSCWINWNLVNFQWANEQQLFLQELREFLVPGSVCYCFVVINDDFVNHHWCKKHLEMQFSISIWDAWENYWGTDWKLLELPIHLKPLTIQKHGECVYVHGHLCILYISEHSPFKAPDLKLCKVFQSRPYPQLCDINSPLLAEACNSPCTLTWAYKPLILNNQNTHTILN